MADTMSAGLAELRRKSWHGVNRPYAIALYQFGHRLAAGSLEGLASLNDLEWPSDWGDSEVRSPFLQSIMTFWGKGGFRSGSYEAIVQLIYLLDVVAKWGDSYEADAVVVEILFKLAQCCGFDEEKLERVIRSLLSTETGDLPQVTERLIAQLTPPRAANARVVVSLVDWDRVPNAALTAVLREALDLMQASTTSFYIELGGIRVPGRWRVADDWRHAIELMDSTLSHLDEQGAHPQHRGLTLFQEACKVVAFRILNHPLAHLVGLLEEAVEIFGGNDIALIEYMAEILHPYTVEG